MPFGFGPGSKVLHAAKIANCEAVDERALSKRPAVRRALALNKATSCAALGFDTDREFEEPDSASSCDDERKVRTAAWVPNRATQGRLPRANGVAHRFDQKWAFRGSEWD